MREAKDGDTVLVHYTGTLDDGTVFDSSADREPLEFTLGEGMVVPGFEALVRGLAVGAKKKGRIVPEDAYGERHEEMTAKVPRSQFPSDMELELGDALQLRADDGRVWNVVVTGLADETVTLDGNHPLAGQALTFEVTLVEIRA